MGVFDLFDEVGREVHGTGSDTIQTSKTGKDDRSDVAFYRALLTRNAATIVARFMIYALDQAFRPTNFNLRQLSD